jgi:hypothetical protein
MPDDNTSASSPDGAPGRAVAPDSTLAWARFYAGLGWSVVPVRPGEKIPAIPWSGFQQARPSMAQLDDWFGVGGYGIGIVTGRVSGIFVLDFDGEAGQEQLIRLEREHGPLPPTVSALTPGGGIHLLFQHPGTPVATRKNVLPGLDIRGDGGFIVGHPSVHRNGRRYEWDADAHPEDVAIAPAPQWVLNLVRQASPTGTAATTSIIQAAQPGPLGLPTTVIADGRESYMRDTILAVLRAMRDQLGRLPTADELFAEVWPQYSHKVDLTRPGRGADEVMAKIRYTLHRVAAGAVVGLQAAPAASAHSHAADVEAVSQAISDVFPTLDIAALSSLPPVEWLIDGILTTDGFGITYGPPASLKSFLLISWALHIASGTPWLDHKVRQGGVLYVAGEGVRGMGRRIRAWMRHHKLEGVDLPFRLLPASVNLTEPEQLARLVRTAVAAADAEGTPIALVVIDTVARAIPGADENSAQDMGRFVAAIEHIKSQVACHVHGVHHSGKDPDRGARGSSALLGAVDTMIRVTREEDQVTVEVEKQKDDDEAKPIALQIERVDLSHALTIEHSLVLVQQAEVKTSAPARPPVASTPEPTVASVTDMALLLEVAGMVRPGGRMFLARLVAALGTPRGRTYARINDTIPLAPAAADVIWNDTPVRLWRTRTGLAANSPVEVVCAEI